MKIIFSFILVSLLTACSSTHYIVEERNILLPFKQLSKEVCDYITIEENPTDYAVCIGFSKQYFISNNIRFLNQKEKEDIQIIMSSIIANSYSNENQDKNEKI